MAELQLKWVLAVFAGIIAVCYGQPNERAFCFSADNCDRNGFIGVMIVRECCEQLESGLSYVLDGVKDCFPCVVYGWNSTQLVARERNESYTIDIVVQKGSERIFGAQLKYEVRLVPGGTAIQGEDFTFDRPTIDYTIAPSPRFFPIPVTLNLTLDGVQREEDETFALELVLTSGFPSNTFFFNGRLNVIIEDGDPVAVNITIMVDIRVTEGDTGEVCVIAIQQDFTRSIPVQIMYTDGTAIENVDYLATTTEVFITPEQNFEACFNLSIIDDEMYESEKEFLLTISTTDMDVTINNAAASVSIQDNDVLMIGWEQASYAVSESQAEAEVCIAIGGTPESALPAIEVATQDGTAIQGMDYIALSTSIIISETSQARICFQIALIDNLVFESLLPEFFLVELTFPGVDRVEIKPQSTQVNITDDEVVSIGFMPASLNVSEGQGSFTACITKDMETVEQFDVTIVSMSGSAMNGSDFDASKIPSVTVLPPGDTTVCFTAENVLIDDSLALEPTVSFILMIDGVEPFNAERVAINQETLEVFIVDDDSVTVGFVVAEAETTEDAGVLDVCIDASGGILASVLSIDVSYSSVTAQEGSDYVPLVSTVSLLQSGTQTCFNIEIVDDQVHETAESFVVHLSSNVSGVVLSQPYLTVTIQDDDNLTIGFMVGEAEVTEGVEFLEVCVEAGEDFVSDVEINLSYNDITAQEGSDYVPLVSTVVLMQPDMQTCFNISIVDDQIHETAETFVVHLSTNDPGVLLGVMYFTATIQDDDSVSVEFESADYTVSESAGFVMVCLTRGVTGAEMPFAVNVVSMDRTAIAGLDYQGGNFIVIFSASSDATQCFNVTLLSDSEREPEESFVLNFVPDPGLQLGAAATVIITDVMRTDVNDTISGDPVLTVPIFVSEEQLQSIPADRLSLCYEVHGKSNEWFNLVSDECTSVNALYVGLSDRLNIIDDITVRTVDNLQQCVNISVSIETGCSAIVNGVQRSRYSSGGVSIRSFSNRVRISVPNCNDMMLVMWVMCEENDFQVVDDTGPTSIRRNAIKFVVMRGLNYGNRQAHGLLGQFWNIPVSIAPFFGTDIFGDTLEDHYMVNITTGANRRSYVGMLAHITWENEEGPCLYVGDSQSFSVYEIETPNDAVIEGVYTDYIVSSGFDDSFEFGIFQADKCN